MTAPASSASASSAIPQLRFAVAGARALPAAAVPTLDLQLVIERLAGSPVRSATVGVRVDIAAGRRAYDPQTESRLVELFGEPQRWGETLRTLGWARATVLVGAVQDRTSVALALPLSYDFDVAAHKYLHALRDGEIPLELSFSGSLLYECDGRIQAAPIPWDCEASWRLPVAMWREAMDGAFPSSAWLRLGREAFDRLYAFKAQRSLTSWDAALEALLDAGSDRLERSWTA